MNLAHLTGDEAAQALHFADSVERMKADNAQQAAKKSNQKETAK